MIVVSDTSAITSLIKIGRIHLLVQLYQKVFIPEAVREEVQRRGFGLQISSQTA